MSAKNQPQNKKLRRLERSLRKDRLPHFIDLRQWLRDRGYASTAGEARQMLLDGRVLSESHPLGTKIIDAEEPTKEQAFEKSQKKEPIERKVIFWPYVNASLRNTLKLKEV